jgi:hypothetical protein
MWAAELAAALFAAAGAFAAPDVKIPRALVHQIETDYRAFLTKNEIPRKENIRRKPLNMSVELAETRPAAPHENARVVTPSGGDVIDLGELVTPLRGAFSLKLLARNENGSEPLGLRVFFVSRAKTRILDGEEYGAGCDKYMEITSYYQKRAAGHGFELYTADQRYLSVVGGTFVAVAFEKQALDIGSVTFTDSRYPNLLCE